MDIAHTDILKLAELLNPKRDNSDSDSDEELAAEDSGPVNTGKTAKRKQSVYAKQEPVQEVPKVYDPLNPEAEDALYFTEDSAVADWKKTPEWSVSYKQQVTSSDVFLQMGAKNPSTASCEDMILKIHLPSEDFYNIDIKITENQVKLISSKYSLEAPLPQTVDPQKGNAQWDKETEMLIVTLRMNREFDFINF